MSDDRINAAELQDYAGQIMRAHGIDEPQIRSVGEILIWSELVGRANFGLVRLPIHIKRVASGVLHCPCRAKFEPLSPCMELLDGDDGFGHYIGALAMQRAIALSRDQGAGIVGVRNSNFFGIGAYFVNLAAQDGKIGLAMSNSFPKVAAHGGIKPVFGTNPFAFGAPRQNGEHLMVDMATSALAGSTVRSHVRNNNPLPPGLAINKEGAPITDPQRIGEGALLPFGGAKGYGLALLVEILAGVITGAGVSNGVASLYEDFSQSGHSGHFLMALDVARWMPMEAYYARIESLIGIVKSSHPNHQVLLPGEIRWQNYQDNITNGIALESNARRSLLTLSQPHGIKAPW